MIGLFEGIVRVLTGLLLLIIVAGLAACQPSSLGTSC